MRIHIDRGSDIDATAFAIFEKLFGIASQGASRQGRWQFMDMTEKRQRPKALDVIDVWDFGSPEKPITLKQWADWYNVKSVHGYGHLDMEFNLRGMLEIRTAYIKQCGFGIVTKELIDALLPWCVGNVVEVGSGSGWLAAHLKAAGLSLECYDDKSWHDPWAQTYTDIITGDGAANVGDADTVIMSWPDYAGDFAKRVIDAMRHGARLLYCGEGDGGCTGDKSFHETVNDTWRKDFDKAVGPLNRCFDGIHDRWQLWVKPGPARIKLRR